MTRRFNSVLSNARAAIDLASIMVGVLVIAVVSGIAAVLVFAVIPWSQNEAARSSVAAVSTAEGVVMAQLSGYSSMAELVASEHLPADDAVTAVTDADGTCYVAISKSAAGPLFFGTESSPGIAVLDRDTTSDCVSAAELADAVDSIGGWDGEPAPVITTRDLPSTQKGAPYDARVEFTAGSDATMRLSGDLPDGITFDDRTGVFHGAATKNGRYTFTVEVANTSGKASRTFVVDVGPAAPRITTGALPDALKGETYSAIIEFVGEDAMITTSILTPLPAGLTLDSATGVISGTPTTFGKVDFSVTAMNAAGSALQALSIDVGQESPVITRGQLPDGNGGVLYSEALTWTGAVDSFSVSLGSLPDGTTLDPAAGVISGSPSRSGIFAFTITAMNAGGLSAVAYQVRIVEAAPTITTNSLPDATQGLAYSAALGGTGDNVRYTTSLGSPPAGIVVDSVTGVVSGRPTNTGASTFTVTKSNAGGSTAVALRIDVQAPAPAAASDFTWSVVLATKKATVTGYVGASKDVVVPKTYSTGGVVYSVDAIAPGAFMDKLLTSAILPDSLTTIGQSALRSNQLTHITIPDSVTSVGTFAFAANKLTSVVIGASVPTISSSMFDANRLTTVVIPASVTKIMDKAFMNNQLTSVTIGNSVASIGTNAFAYNKLATVVIPNSVTTLSGGAFGDNELTSVVLPSGLARVEARAFSTNKLTTVTIPASVSYIGDEAFYGNGLTSVSLGSGVADIGTLAFGKNMLTTVTLPASVTKLASEAFGSNPLASVYMQGNAPALFSNAGPSAPFNEAAGKTVYHRASATGYGNPWRGYVTASY